MKFCSVAVLGFIATATADVGHKNDRKLADCPPPPYPPPPPKEGEPGKWVWRCPEEDDDDGYVYEDDRWNNDGYVESDDGGDDGGWGDDGFVEVDDGGGDDGWQGDGGDDGVEWQGDGGDDGHVETDDGGWNGDSHVEEPEIDEGTWNDDGHAGNWTGDGHQEDEGWTGDGFDEPGEESVDRQPAMSDSLMEGEEASSEQESKSVPVGAVAGASAAAGVAALIALAAVAKKRREDRFIDADDKASIGTFGPMPSPEARMAREDDIEVDHTFFDENLYNENYQGQELKYNNQRDQYPETEDYDDESSYEEERGYHGDDASF